MDNQVTSRRCLAETLLSDCSLDTVCTEYGAVALDDSGQEQGRSLAHGHVKLVVSCTKRMHLCYQHISLTRCPRRVEKIAQGWPRGTGWGRGSGCACGVL